jgi:hypothetical protein
MERYGRIQLTRLRIPGALKLRGVLELLGSELALRPDHIKLYFPGT